MFVLDFTAGINALCHSREGPASLRVLSSADAKNWKEPGLKMGNTVANTTKWLFQYFLLGKIYGNMMMTVLLFAFFSL